MAAQARRARPPKPWRSLAPAIARSRGLHQVPEIVSSRRSRPRPQRLRALGRDDAKELVVHRAEPSRHLRVRRAVDPELGRRERDEVLPVGGAVDEPDLARRVAHDARVELAAADHREQVVELVDGEDAGRRVVDRRRERLARDVDDDPEAERGVLLHRPLDAERDGVAERGLVHRGGSGAVETEERLADGEEVADLRARARRRTRPRVARSSSPSASNARTTPERLPLHDHPVGPARVERERGVLPAFRRERRPGTWRRRPRASPQPPSSSPCRAGRPRRSAARGR